jgi:hypothetical protein
MAVDMYVSYSLDTKGDAQLVRDYSTFAYIASHKNLIQY